jgi:hypothetical protein
MADRYLPPSLPPKVEPDMREVSGTPRPNEVSRGAPGLGHTSTSDSRPVASDSTPLVPIGPRGWQPPQQRISQVGHAPVRPPYWPYPSRNVSRYVGDQLRRTPHGGIAPSDRISELPPGGDSPPTSISGPGAATSGPPSNPIEAHQPGKSQRKRKYYRYHPRWIGSGARDTGESVPTGSFQPQKATKQPPRGGSKALDEVAAPATNHSETHQAITLPANGASKGQKPPSSVPTGISKHPNAMKRPPGSSAKALQEPVALLRSHGEADKAEMFTAKSVSDASSTTSPIPTGSLKEHNVKKRPPGGASTALSEAMGPPSRYSPDGRKSAVSEPLRSSQDQNGTTVPPSGRRKALLIALSPPSNHSEDRKSGKAPLNKASASRKTTNSFTGDVSKDLHLTLVPPSSSSKELQNVMAPSSSHSQAEKTAKPPRVSRASAAWKTINSVLTGVSEEQSAEKLPPSGGSNALQQETSPPRDRPEAHKAGKVPPNRASAARKTVNPVVARLWAELDATRMLPSGGSPTLLEQIFPPSNRSEAHNAGRFQPSTASAARNTTNAVRTVVSEEHNASATPASGGSGTLHQPIVTPRNRPEAHTAARLPPTTASHARKTTKSVATGDAETPNPEKSPPSSLLNAAKDAMAPASTGSDGHKDAKFTPNRASDIRKTTNSGLGGRSTGQNVSKMTPGGGSKALQSPMAPLSAYSKVPKVGDVDPKMASGAQKASSTVPAGISGQKTYFRSHEWKELPSPVDPLTTSIAEHRIATMAPPGNVAEPPKAGLFAPNRASDNRNTTNSTPIRLPKEQNATKTPHSSGSKAMRAPVALSRTQTEAGSTGKLPLARPSEARTTIEPIGTPISADPNETKMADIGGSDPLATATGKRQAIDQLLECDQEITDHLAKRRKLMEDLRGFVGPDEVEVMKAEISDLKTSLLNAKSELAHERAEREREKVGWELQLARSQDEVRKREAEKCNLEERLMFWKRVGLGSGIFGTADDGEGGTSQGR